MSVPKCTSWLGHKFEARFSSLPFQPISFTDLGVNDLSEYTFVEIQEMRMGKTYERDICVRCGHVIERAQTEETPDGH